MNRALWPILSGFTLWAIAFVALYGLQYLGCYFGWPEGNHRAVLIAAYALTLLILAGFLAFQISAARTGGSPSTIEKIGIGTTIAALAAAAITFAPALLISACT